MMLSIESYENKKINTKRNHNYLPVINIIQSADSKLTLRQTSLGVNLSNYFFHCTDGLLKQAVICMPYWSL